MKLVRACLDNPKEYSASLTQLLPEFSDNQALVIEFLDFAVDYFNGREQLLKKYLLLALIRDGLKKSCKKLVNKLSLHQRLLDYFVKIVDHYPGISDISQRALSRFNNEQPHVSVKFFTLILELIKYCGEKFRTTKEGSLTKFRSIYSSLLDKNIKFPDQFIEMDADVREIDQNFKVEKPNNLAHLDSEPSPKPPPQQAQHQLQEKDLQDINQIQLELTEQIEMIYDMLNQQTEVGFEDTIDFLHPTYLNAKDLEERLHRLQEEHSNAISKDQNEQILLISNCISTFDLHFRKLKKNQNSENFLEFQHHVLQIASKVLNKSYQPTQAYIRSKQNNQPEPANHYSHNQQDSIEYPKNQDQARKVKSQPQYQQPHQEKEPPIPNYPEEQFQEKKVEKSQTQPFQGKGIRIAESEYPNPSHEGKPSGYTQQTKKPTFQDLYTQNYQEPYMKETFARNDNQTDAYQPPPKPYYEERSYHQGEKLSEPSQYSHLSQAGKGYSTENYQAPRSNPISEQKLETMGFNSLLNSEELLRKIYDYTAIDNWKRSCIEGQGPLFENDDILITTKFCQQYQVLNAKRYLQVQLFFTNKRNQSLNLQVAYLGNRTTKFWLKPSELPPLVSEIQQTLIIGRCQGLIKGRLKVNQVDCGQFALPTTQTNFVDFLEIRHDIFLAKERKAQYLASDHFRLRASKEELRILKFCEISAVCYGAIFENHLVKLQHSQEGWRLFSTSREMLNDLLFLLS